VNRTLGVQIGYLSVLCSVVVDGVRIGESKARISKNKTKNNESFKVMTTMNVFSAQANYLNALCNIVVLTF
jgi:hypothetical protein